MTHSNREFSHDVTSAILASRKNESETILYFPIAHNSLWLPPTFCINYCCENALGNTRTSQEYFTTILYAKFLGGGGTNRVNYGQLENRE